MDYIQVITLYGSGLESIDKAIYSAEKKTKIARIFERKSIRKKSTYILETGFRYHGQTLLPTYQRPIYSLSDVRIMACNFHINQISWKNLQVGALVTIFWVNREVMDLTFVPEKQGVFVTARVAHKSHGSPCISMSPSYTRIHRPNMTQNIRIPCFTRTFLTCNSAAKKSSRFYLGTNSICHNSVVPWRCLHCALSPPRPTFFIVSHSLYPSRWNVIKKVNELAFASVNIIMWTLNGMQTKLCISQNA